MSQLDYFMGLYLDEIAGPDYYYITICVNQNKLQLFLGNVSILYLLKTPENQRFLVFLVSIKWEHWPK